MKQCMNCKQTYPDHVIECSCGGILAVVPEGWTSLYAPPSVIPTTVQSSSAVAAVPASGINMVFGSMQEPYISSFDFTRIERIRDASIGHPQVIYTDRQGLFSRLFSGFRGQGRRNSVRAQVRSRQPQNAEAVQAPAQPAERPVWNAAARRENARRRISGLNTQHVVPDGEDGANTDGEGNAGSLFSRARMQNAADDAAAVAGTPLMTEQQEPGMLQAHDRAEAAQTDGTDRAFVPLQRGRQEGGRQRRRRGLRPDGAVGVVLAVLRQVLPTLLLLGALTYIVLNWGCITAVLWTFAGWWIAAFLAVVVFRGGFRRLDTIVGVSTILAVIAMLVQFNIGNLGTTMHEMISGLAPLIILGAVLWYMLRPRR